MKRLVFTLALLFSAAAVHAAGPTCTMSAAEKKLAGAAKTSFMTKCQNDAAAACDAQAAERKLAGAAKNSFVKKCVTDAVGG